jgi:hypothetical protein
MGFRKECDPICNPQRPHPALAMGNKKRDNPINNPKRPPSLTLGPGRDVILFM